jgi:hypothetical protein
VVGPVRAVFSWPYAALTPAGARLFRLVGLPPGPALTVPAVASPATPSIVDVRSLLSELTATGLLTEQAPGRYGWHDLLAALNCRPGRNTAVRPAVSGECWRSRGCAACGWP